MIVVIAAVAGIVGAVVGYVVAALAAMLYAAVTGMSNFEGAAGMFAVFGIGPIGGLIGLILGIVLTVRWRARDQGTDRMMLRGALALVAIGALITGGLGILYLMDDVLNRNGAAPRLVFDLRLPPGLAADARGLTVELHTDKNTGAGVVFAKSERPDGDRIAVSGSVELYFRTSQRILAIKRQGEPDRLFQLKLPASPAHMREPSAWQAVDFVAAPGEAPTRRSGDDYQLRYRVVWAGED